MALITQRATSILYGASGGVALLMLTGIPDGALVVLFTATAMATELYRGVRDGGR